jgi:hypothetical protein
MPEAETRAEHIDPALKAAGWGVVNGSRILREYHITPGRIEGGGRKGKAEIADYILVYKNTKLAVVDKGLGQAADGRGGAGEELCGEAGDPFQLRDERVGDLCGGHARGRGGRCRFLPDSR